jgi:3-oxoacyl-[acyl-carrier-protein] synthase II
MAKRVVITGVGLVTPIGCGTEKVWRRLIQGDCGIRSIESAGISIPEGCHISVAGFVPRSVDSTGMHFDEHSVFGRSVSKEFSSFIQYAVCASESALKHANLNDILVDLDKHRIGTCIASGNSSQFSEASQLLVSKVELDHYKI